MGGRDRLLIRVFGDQDVADTILPASAGGKAKVGLVERISADKPNAPETNIEFTGGLDLHLIASAWDAADDPKPDLVVLSLRAELNARVAKGDAIDDVAAAALVKRIKDAGCHVIAYGIPTVIGSVGTANYRKVSSDPAELLAHRINLVLIELSYLEGISLVDTDRLIAEMGALEHMVGDAEYSPEACDAIGAELYRIIDEYGFFEPKPLMMQVGHQGGAK